MLSMNITASRIYGDIPMKTPKTLAGSIALLLIALAILGFGISPVSASAFQWQNSNSTTMHGQEHHFAFNSTRRATMTSSFITRLQNQGVDVSTIQTALQNNDTATVNSWLKSYFESHKGSFGNTTHTRRGYGFAINKTVRQAHLQSFITNLQNKGVDVSTVQTALQNNDTASVNLWLKSYFASHPAIMNNTTRSRWHQRNTTATQSS
jgi:DNA-binding transcriptional MerR regulator